MVLNITDSQDWRHQVVAKGGFHVGVYIPKRDRSGFIHPSREDAEKEAVRLACETGGQFAILELTAIVSGQPLADSDWIKRMGAGRVLVPKWETEKVEI